MLEFMSCSRPVILGVDGQAREILKDANAGIFVAPEDVSALVKAIMDLTEDAGLRKTLGENGRNHILQNFSREQTATLYLKVLAEVVPRV